MDRREAVTILCERVMKDPDNRPEYLTPSLMWKKRRYYRFLALLAQEMQPDLIVELGTNNGAGALHFKWGWPEADVVTIDIIQKPQTVKLLLKYGVTPIQGDSIASAPQITIPIDILFIDASHEYGAVMNELEAYLPRMGPGGVICFDDIKLNDGMKKAWAEASGGEKIELNELHLPSGFGVMVID